MFAKCKEIYMTAAMSRKWRISRVIIGVVAGLAVLAGAIQMTSPVFQTSFRVSDIRVDGSTQCNFNISQTEQYSIELNMKAQGFITALRIVGQDDSLAYQNLGENFSFTTDMTLNKGDYTLTLTYLKDMDEIEQFLANTGQSTNISTSDKQYYMEAFSHVNNDYSANFSILVNCH